MFFNLFKNKSYDEKLKEESDAINKKSVDCDDPVFIVDDVFTISGIGLVVTGVVKSGEFFVNDRVLINGDSVAVITKIEMFRKIVECASTSDHAGFALSVETGDTVKCGDIITK